MLSFLAFDQFNLSATVVDQSLSSKEQSVIVACLSCLLETLSGNKLGYTGNIIETLSNQPVSQLILNNQVFS